MKSRGDRVALSAFLVSSILAGGNAVAVRFSNRELEPLWSAGLRFALSAALLLTIVAVRRLPLPRGRALAGSSLYGLIGFGLAFALAYYALVHIHAGLQQTILALVPLATLLLAVLQRQERLSLAPIVGTALALAGVAVISGASLGQGVPLLSLLAGLGAMLCFAEATVLIRRMPSVHPVTLNAVGMVVGAVFLLVASFIAGETWRLPHRAVTWIAIAYLVVFGSVGVFVFYAVVLKYWAASRAAYSFVITPLITVLLSAWLDNEPIGLALLAGGPLIVAGVYVGALRPARRATSQPAASPEDDFHRR
jgi:drug/metabolite transporter (DMT)-like permease